MFFIATKNEGEADDNGSDETSYLTVTIENFQKPLKIIETKFWITNQTILAFANK